jgi:putative alpha-1,2-mannosidase
MGFYPVTPGSGQYVIGSPLFDKVTLTLPNGKNFVITAQQNNADSPYIQQASFNGKPLQQSWLAHQNILAGGELKFLMGPEPEKSWASTEQAVPYSMSLELSGKKLVERSPETPDAATQPE